MCEILTKINNIYEYVIIFEYSHVDLKEVGEKNVWNNFVSFSSIRLKYAA